MLNINGVNIQLPWNQHDKYWISVYAKSGSLLPRVKSYLEQAGLHASHDDGMSVCTGREWKAQWDTLYAGLQHTDMLDEVEIAFTPDAENPAPRAKSECKTPAVIQLVSENVWLGEALMSERLMCYLQPVVSANGKTFGYESFARVKALDGQIIGGDKIINASKALGIEYVIDRQLHVQAIKTFVSSEFNGFLFVNFFPGFIHRPSIYLEGLTDTARNIGLVAKNIVLDFTKSEMPRDIQHLQNVCDYARIRGYSIALDDISSIDNAKKLISEIRPDFVKIDMHLVQGVKAPSNRDTIRGIVDLAHRTSITVLAEGVETEEVFQALKQLGVDLFQGYLFSAPVPVEMAFRRDGAALQ